MGAGGTQHSRRSGLKQRQPSSGLGSALKTAADRFVERVVMRGVT